MALIVDRIARRYGRLPHEVLDLTPYQLGIALVCVQAATEATATRARAGGMVFPVLSVDP